MVFPIHLTEDEKHLADSYTKLHSMSLGDAFKRALFDKIEEEYDVALGEGAYREYVENRKNSYSFDEATEILDL